MEMSDLHKKLLDLSLEMAAAKDAVSAINSFERFLKQRQPSAKISHREELAPEVEVHSKFYYQKSGSSFFVFAFKAPTVIEVEGGKENFEPEELKILEKLVQFFVEKMSTIDDLRGLTHTDDLTGLFNQRYLELILDREISLSKRNNTEFSVLFLDLDHFKSVNDTHGHLIGSRLLFEVGEEIKRALRDSDITFRYGGDEFVVILSHTGLEDAIMVAERVRQQIEKKRFLARENMDIRLTASIGVASVPLHAANKQQILKAADEALYGVKKAVRNKVIAATNSLKD